MVEFNILGLLNMLKGEMKITFSADNSKKTNVSICNRCALSLIYLIAKDLILVIIPFLLGLHLSSMQTGSHALYEKVSIQYFNKRLIYASTVGDG